MQTLAKMAEHRVFQQLFFITDQTPSMLERKLLRHVSPKPHLSNATQGEPDTPTSVFIQVKLQHVCPRTRSQIRFMSAAHRKSPSGHLVSSNQDEQTHCCSGTKVCVCPGSEHTRCIFTLTAALKHSDPPGCSGDC